MPVTGSDTKSPNTVRRALSLSFLQTFTSGAATFTAIVIVSHILTPAEIGIFSVAAGVVALIHMLRDFGLSEFLVQEEQLDERKVRTVFTVNLIVAWLLAAAIVLSSGPLGRFYGEPGVTRVLRVLSVVVALLPFGAIPQTLMRRDLAFGRLLGIRLSQNLAQAGLMVGLAMAGFTYMSMAWSALGSTLVMLAGCAVWGWGYRVKGLALGEWRRVLSFGSNRTLSDIASQLGEQSANLVIGRMLGMADTGLYSRGYGIVNMYRMHVGDAIASVAFPAFAREHRETGTAPQLFLRALVYSTGIAWPFFSAGVLLALPVIRVVFGPQWGAAVPLMRWLCAAALVGALIWECNHFLVALGRVRDVTRVEMQFQCIRIGLTIGAAFVNVVAVAAVQVLVYVIATALYYRELRCYAPLLLRHCARAVLPSALVALATCVIPALVVAWPGLVSRHMILALCIAVGGGCASWLACVRIIQHPLLGEIARATARFPALRRVLCG